MRPSDQGPHSKASSPRSRRQCTQRASRRKMPHRSAVGAQCVEVYTVEATENAETHTHVISCIDMLRYTPYNEVLAYRISHKYMLFFLQLGQLHLEYTPFLCVNIALRVFRFSTSAGPAPQEGGDSGGGDRGQGPRERHQPGHVRQHEGGQPQDQGGESRGVIYPPNCRSCPLGPVPEG